MKSFLFALVFVAGAASATSQQPPNASPPSEAASQATTAESPRCIAAEPKEKVTVAMVNGKAVAVRQQPRKQPMDCAKAVKLWD